MTRRQIRQFCQKTGQTLEGIGMLCMFLVGSIDVDRTPFHLVLVLTTAVMVMLLTGLFIEKVLWKYLIRFCKKNRKVRSRLKAENRICREAA